MRSENDIAAYAKKESFPGNGSELLRLERWAMYLVIAVVIIAILVLIGWQFNIEFLKQPFPPIVAMNPVTAILFIVCGFSFLLLSDKMLSPQKVLPGTILAYLVLLAGLLRFISEIIRLNFGIDTILYHDRLKDAVTNLPNRMTLNTAFGFILSGIALLLLNVETRKKRMPAQTIAVFIAFVALISIVIHLYRVSGSYSLLIYVPMGINSAICFLLLALAIFFARPGKGLMKEITSPYTGSFIARFLLPTAIIIPVLLGLLRLQGAWAGLFSLEAGTAILILAIIVIFLGLAWFIVVSLNKRDLSKHVTDQALQEAEEQVQTIFDAAPDAVIVMDERGIIIKWNPKAESLLGWKQDEVLGKLLSDTIIPDRFREAHKNGMKHFLRTGEGPLLGKIIETCAVTKTGEELEIALNIAASSKDKNGFLFIGFVRDLTGRKKEEEKFKGLLEAAPDAMIIANEKGEIVLINQQTEILFGYKRHELIGKPVEILIPHDFRSRHQGHRDQYFTEPKVRSMGVGLELFAIRKDGTQFPVEISLSPLVTEEGTLVSASVRDITDRKRSEEKFKGLLEAAPDAMIIANEKGEIVLTNRQTEKLFGYTKEELIGKPVEILIPTDFHKKHIGHRTKYFEDPKVRSMGAGLELFAIRKDGTQIPVEISLSPLVTEEGTLISASVRDITERKKAEEKLRKAKSDFQLLVSSIKDYAIILLDEKGLVASWNSGAEHIKCYTAEEVIGQPMEIFYTEEEKKRGEPRRNLQMALQHGHYETEGLRVRKDGSTFYANIVFTSLVDEEGKLYGYAKVTKDISEKRKAEESLRYLASIADNIQDPVISTDNNFIIIRWNKAAEKLLEWKSEEVTGKTTTEILKVIFPDETREEIFESYKEKGFWRGELIYHTKSGRPLNILSTTSQLKDADGNISGNIVLARDITARKKAEDELNKLNEELEQRVKERTAEIQKNEKRFRALIENNHDIVSMMNESFKVIYRSPSAERITGWSNAEIEAMGGAKNIHPDEIAYMQSVGKELMAHPGKQLPILLRNQHKEGHYLWMEGTVINLLHDENIHAIVFNFRDITERIKAEQKIAATLREKNIILESIADAFFAVDKDWTVTYWNRIAETALSMPKQQIVGKNLWEVFSDSIDSVSYIKYHEAVSTNKVIHFEDHYPALNKWYEISAYPSENGLSVYFKDVTERKEAEEEIKNLNIELEEKVIKRTVELQKANSEMEAFTYSVSHDLRAPLRGITGFTSILVEDYGPQLDDEAKRITNVIKKNALKMGQLIDDLLTFSRMGKQELGKTNINTKTVLNEIIDSLSQENKEVHINWDIRSLASVKGDLNTIRQVWINLLSNAIKYSSKKKQPGIEIGSYLQKGYTVFYVKDNGVGFDEGYKHKLFKVFQRLHDAEEFEGTGVGLAIVEKIVSRHGGKVWAEGKENKGACFYFSLPL